MSVACKTLETSLSGYYAWLKRPISNRQQANEQLGAKIIALHAKSRSTYGVPRIKAALNADGVMCNKKRIYRIMKKNGLHGIQKRRYRIFTTDSKHDLPISPRHFKTEDHSTHPKAANQVWATDISYLQVGDKVHYLAVVLDIFTRKIVGYAVASNMQTGLVLEALDGAILRQKVKPDTCLIHSDRGSQFASESFRLHLKNSGICASMSRKGNCYDNAFCESFFATLKKEWFYPKKKQLTEENFKSELFEYIEVWYNRERLHSGIQYSTPAGFESVSYAS